MPHIVHDMLPRQCDFLDSTARQVLYSGAYGAGKTRAVCLKIAMRAAAPTAREGLCRKNLVSLKATTLKTLLEKDGDLEPILPEGSYHHNRADRSIRIHGGGEIVYFGMGDAEDYQKIGSLNLSGCACDEAVELTKADWTMLRGRIRLKHPMGNQLYGACNPGPPSHWLAEQFGLALDYVCNPNCEAFSTSTHDNSYLPPEYVADLDTLEGVAHKRYVLGLWVGSDGLVYDRWNRDTHVQKRDIGQFVRFIVGADEGYTNPAVLLCMGLDMDDRLHIVEEWYERGQLEQDVVDAARALDEKHGVSEFVVDPSAAKLIAALQKAGLYVRPADNDVYGGIQAVQQRLAVPGDGRPRLTVDPGCTNTIREMESYEWKPQTRGMGLKDEPIKRDDHAMDALRYAVVSVDGLRVVPQLLAPGGDEEDDGRFPADDDFMWTEVA